MTLIAGLNLSDRLYLMADTRVTVNDQIKIDNVCKIMPIYGKTILDRECKDENHISLATAGNLEFINFLYKAINDALAKKQLSGDIRKLYDEIDEFIKPKVDYWLSGLKKDYKKSCCLLFAGTCDSRPKKINPKKLQKMLKTFNKASKKEKEDYTPLIKKTLKTDERLQLLNKKLLVDAKKDIFAVLEKSHVPTIKPSIQKALDNKFNEMTGVPDSLIFGILIRPSKGDAWLVKDKAEWGEFLFYGTNNISKEDASEELLVKLEFHDSSNNKDHLMEAAILNMEVKSLSEEKGLGKIGGITLINAIKDNKSQIIPCQNGSFFSGSSLYIKLAGSPVPVVTFTKCCQAISKMGALTGDIKL
ncbi:MAG: hypothetical protein JW816_00855 [Candidatus Buchananbacteria bacterium]|nr:hypothetical protein [Candidatus Buchananbacteria bacterium]